jgi:hypothetical protein
LWQLERVSRLDFIILVLRNDRSFNDNADNLEKTGLRAAAVVTMQLAGEEGEQALQKMTHVEEKAEETVDPLSGAAVEVKA